MKKQKVNLPALTEIESEDIVSSITSSLGGYFGDADPHFGDIDPPHRKWFKEQKA